MTNGKRDWRELCLAVAKETDGTKLLDLTQQLIPALDARKSNDSPHSKMDGSIAKQRRCQLCCSPRHRLKTILLRRLPSDCVSFGNV